MVQGSDNDEDWEKICAQEGIELVQESGTESEGRREGWKSDRDNEGTESEMVGEGSESERESVLDSDSESVSDSDSETSESSKHGRNDSDSEYEKESESESVSDSERSKHGSTDSDSEDENTEMTPKSIQVGNKITFECRKCHFKCGSSGRVYSNMYKKHNMKKFECRHCDFSTPSKTSLLNHVRCYCKRNGCEKKKKLVTMKVTVKVDKRIKLPKCLLDREEATFSCQYCKDFTGRSTGVIFTHMCDVHGMKPFSCRKCDFTSKNKTLMYNHETRYCHKLGNKRSD